MFLEIRRSGPSPDVMRRLRICVAIPSDTKLRRFVSLTTKAFAVTASRTVRVVPYLQCTALRTDGRHDCCRPVPTAVCVLIL